MGYMFPNLSCPRELVLSWWKPVEKAGYSIKDLRVLTNNIDDYQRLPDAFSETFLDLSSGGVVFTGAIEIFVSTFSTASQPVWVRGGAPSYYIKCDINDDSEITSDVIDHIKSLTRIFVTSGAHLDAGWKGWKRMYRCSTYDSLLRVWSILREEGFVIVENEISRYVVNIPPSQSIYFPGGRVEGESGSVQVYTGPGINPFTGEDRFYAAIDYSDSLFSRYANRALAKKIGQLLVSIGIASPIDRKEPEVA